MTIKKLHRYRLDCDGGCDTSVVVETEEKWPKTGSCEHSYGFPEGWLEVATRGYGYGEGTVYVYCPKCREGRESL